MAGKKIAPEPIRLLRWQQDPHAPALFLVESASTPIPEGGTWQDVAHHVEIDALPIMLDGKLVYVGECDCPHFRFRLHKLAQDGMKPRRCGHLKRIRHVIADDAIVCWVAKNVPPHP